MFAVFQVVAGLVLSVALLWSTPVEAGADSNRFSDFRKSVSTLLAAMESYCRTKGAGSLVAGAEPLANYDAFMAACARSLAGKEIPNRPGWEFFYDETSQRQGVVRVIGARRALEGNGTSWSLILGQRVQIYYPHQRPEQVTKRPEATLFELGDRTWNLFWRYVDPAADRWRRAPIPVGSGLNIDEKRAAGFIEKVYQENVIHGFPQMAHSLRDTRGMGFDE